MAQKKTDSSILREQYRPQMEQFKYEVADTLGATYYRHVDKGMLPARLHGYVGGNMTKTMIGMAEQMIGQNGGAVQVPITTEGKEFVQAIDENLIAMLNGMMPTQMGGQFQANRVQ